MRVDILHKISQKEKPRTNRQGASGGHTKEKLCWRNRPRRDLVFTLYQKKENLAGFSQMSTHQRLAKGQLIVPQPQGNQ
jgi:DNA modification methylase